MKRVFCDSCEAEATAPDDDFLVVVINGVSVDVCRECADLPVLRSLFLAVGRAKQKAERRG